MLSKISKKLTIGGWPAQPGFTQWKRFSLVWLGSSLATLVVLLGLRGMPAAASAPSMPEIDSGFSLQPAAQITPSPTITPLDVVVVFDISGSMEDQTICHDCWVRETYDVINRPYPSNGYFNSIPYDPDLAPGAPDQSIPDSRLCTDPPTPWLQSNGTITYSYLTVEAELYSANVGDWNLAARTPGLPDYQSSNVCNPVLSGGVDCTLTINGRWV